MTGKERIELALQRKQADCVPTFEWFISKKVCQAITGSPDPVETVDALDIDAFNIRADYSKNFTSETTFVDEWGATKQLTGDYISATLKSPITDITRHMEYTFPDPKASHRFEGLEKVMNRFGDKRAVILNLRDGFSDLRDLLGYEEALIQFMIEPDLFVELLNRAVDYNLELARIARSRFGINIVATTDDIAKADGLLFRPELYMERIGPAFKRVIQGYKEMGCYVIKHCDGDVSDVLDFWVESGIDCLDPIDPAGGMRLDDIRAKYGSKICLKGNIDCKGALCDGTAEQVTSQVKDAMQQSGKPAYICSSSNTIHQGVNPDNFRAMLDAIRLYGKED